MSRKATYLNSGKQALKRRPNRYRRASGGGLSGPSAPLLRRGLFFVGGLAFLAALMAALYFGYSWVTTTSAFALQEIRVEGNERLSYGDVLRAGRVRLGQNCLGLNVSRVEALLGKSPWVENVSVRRQLPDRLVITLTEKEPAYWVRRGGALYYADEQGELISAVSPADFRSLPVLEADPAMREHLGALPEIMQRLGESGVKVADNALAWVRITGAGQAELYLDSPGLTLTFGLEDWRSELRRVRAVTDDVLRRGEMDGVHRITAAGGKVWVEKTP